MTDATELDEAPVQAQVREHVIRCRVERGYGEGNDEAFASTDATFLLTALDKARTDLPAALDEITRLRAALDEARADAAAANGALEAAPEVLRLAEMSDQVGVWMARAEAAESALAAVTAERDRLLEAAAACPRGITGHACCDCRPHPGLVKPNRCEQTDPHPAHAVGRVGRRCPGVLVPYSAADDEEFCPRCLAGTESAEHREKCGSALATPTTSARSDG